MLSDKAKELIVKSRIVAVTSWSGAFSQRAIAVVQSADEERRYLTDDDLQALQAGASVPLPWIAISQQLRDQASSVVDEARTEVLTAFPHITDPGGGLYPPARAEACWRDFWHFLRCITYGIAGAQVQYTSAEGLASLKELYQELQVPLDAMVLGLEGLKAASLNRIHRQHRGAIAPYFDHLLHRLRQF